MEILFRMILISLGCDVFGLDTIKKKKLSLVLLSSNRCIFVFGFFLYHLKSCFNL